MNGQILAGDVIDMEWAGSTRLQKTFSLAITQEFAPNARLVALAVLSNGHVISDSLGFIVKDFRGEKVSVQCTSFMNENLYISCCYTFINYSSN